MHSKPQTFQIFLESPQLQIPTQTLTLSPIQTPTLYHLKLSLFSQTLPSLYFTLNGKPLFDSTPLLSSEISPLSTLILQFRAPGGGGDGGATGAESRDCYLNMYAEKKPDKVDPYEQRLSKFLNCALSNEPLKDPCVVDLLGNVFNKEPLVEALLGKKVPKAFGHIKGLRDMVPVHFTSINLPESESQATATGPRFQCPITGLEFNGKSKFLALRSCGHVLSAKALKEVKSSACLVCHVGFSEEDKIVINGNEEEVAALRERMESEKAKSRGKKVKKTKNGEGVGNAEEEGVEGSRLSGTKHGIDVKGVEKASAKVEGNGKVGNGGENVKGVSNGPAVKKFKAGDAAPANATKEVYASIFTSSSKKKFKETYSCRSLPLGRN
ncbi:putative replication termination factor 2 [Rosa chinensis]|uniref:Putative replication termination factor 2 n=1 Tax=Rosa chinensis TaxID=74649 RepID=A0A2P6RIB1_ROSCH|nr:replication termination factor 2 [Rosa chinensis]PRQ46147.1 putative replication termination factor 2 [Rosa chinensis]